MRSGKGTGSSNWLLVAAGLLLLPLLLVAFGTFDDENNTSVGAGDSAVLPAPDVAPPPTDEVTSTNEPTLADDATPTARPTTPPPEPTATAVPEPTPTPTTEPTPTAVPEPEPTPEPDVGEVVRSNPDTVLPADAPDDVARALGRSISGEVPQSQAVISDGRIFLFGAVPDADSAARIVSLATDILGADNVFDFYTIDSRASSASDGDIRVDDNVLFATDSAIIAPEFEPLLNQAVALMTIRPEVEMTVVGHTDAEGPGPHNQDLSERRALAVVHYLVERGIDRGRLVAIGRGERDPIATNDTEDGKELNRRIQVFLANVLS